MRSAAAAIAGITRGQMGPLPITRSQRHAKHGPFGAQRYDIMHEMVPVDMHYRYRYAPTGTQHT